jgi:hypothetical protein
MVTRVKDRKVEELTREEVAPEECAHYWIIETSKGPTSWGVCKRCGGEKEFYNVIPEPQPPAAKREKDPMKLPKMDDVEFDEKQRSS